MVALREKSVDVLDFMTGNEEEEKNANTFHSIIRNDDLEAVRTLLDGKADPNCKTRNKDSACHVTVQKDSNARRCTCSRFAKSLHTYDIIDEKFCFV